jgi:hypothetical protein
MSRPGGDGFRHRPHRPGIPAKKQVAKNISESTYALMKDEPGISFTPRGLACLGLSAGVQAKGKGEMEMYFVSARRRSGRERNC